MGKEVVTVEIDTGLMDRLRAAGIEPAVYLERLLKREALQRESAVEREQRAAAWRQEHKAELDSYDRFIAEHGVWSDGFRQF